MILSKNRWKPLDFCYWVRTLISTKTKFEHSSSFIIHRHRMKSFPTLLGASLLVATSAPVFAKEKEEWRESGEVSSHVTIERVKERTTTLLAPSPQPIQAVSTDSAVGEVLVSRDSDLPPSKITAKKAFFNTIRHDLTPNSRFVLGNSSWLRMGIEFNLSNNNGNTPEFGSTKLGVGILKNGVGIQYVSKF